MDLTHHYHILILLASFLGTVEMNSIHRRSNPYNEDIDLNQICCPSSLNTMKRSIGTLSEHNHRRAYVSNFFIPWFSWLRKWLPINLLKILVNSCFSFPFQLLENEMYQQELREYSCEYPIDSLNPLLQEDPRCQGSCHQLFQSHPVLAVDRHHGPMHNLRVEHILIAAGCRFEPDS